MIFRSDKRIDLVLALRSTFRSVNLLLSWCILTFTLTVYGQNNASYACDNAELWECGGVFYIDESLISKEFVNSCDYRTRENFQLTSNIWRTYIGDGQNLQITIPKSTSVNVYEGPCWNLKCSNDATLVRSDQDLLLNLHSHTEKIYKLLYSAFSEERLIELESNCITPPINDSPDGAVELICGSHYNEDIRYCSRSPYCENDNFPVRWFKIVGNDQIVQLSAGYSTLFKVYESYFDSHDCFSHLSINQLDEFKAKKGITYWIAVGSERNDLISFSMSCREELTNEVCESSDFIDCLDTISNELVDYKSIGESPSYTFYRRIIGSGQYLGFSRLKENSQNIQISSNLCGDPNSFSSIKNDQEVYLEVGEVYLLRFQFNINNLDQKYIVQCIDASELSTCIEATSIGSTNAIVDTIEYQPPQENLFQPNGATLYGLWYHIEGDDEIFSIWPSHGITILVYEGSCGMLTPISNNWFAKKGRSYYLFIGSESFNASFEVALRRNPIASNRLPENAIELSCDVELDLNFDSSILSSYCDINKRYPLYYKYVNEFDGDIFLNPRGVNNQYSVNYYKAAKSDFCEATSNFIAPGDSILVEFQSELSRARISIECIEPRESNGCYNVDVIAFDSSYITVTANVNDLLVKYSDLGRCTSKAYPMVQHWYEIIGDDMLYTFDIDRFSNFRLYLYEDACDLQSCLRLIDDYETLKLEQGISYYICASRLERSLPISSINGTFDIYRKEASPHDFCANTTEYSCNDTIPFDPFRLVDNKAYFTIIGTENLVNFTSTMYPLWDLKVLSNCIDEEPIPPLYDNVYNLEEGITYKGEVELYSSSTEITDVLVECFEPNHTRECYEFLDNYNCQDYIQFRNSDYVRTEELYSVLGRDSVQGRWLSFVGANKEIYFGSNVGMYFTHSRCGTDGFIAFEQEELFLANEDSLFVLLFDTLAAYQQVRVTTSCRNPITEDPVPICENPDTVRCGDQVRIGLFDSPKSLAPCYGNLVAVREYINIKGAGQYVSIRFKDGRIRSHSFIKGNCVSGTCLRRYNEYTYLEDGIDYLIHFDGYSSGFDIEIICEDRVDGASKSDPIQISCGEVVPLDYRFNAQNKTITSCVPELPQKGEWLSFMGNGLIANIDYNISNSNIKVFEINDTDTTCLSQQSSGRKPRFFAKNGVPYLIYVYSTMRDVDPGEFTINCFRRNPGDLCSDQVTLNPCFGEIRANYYGSTGSNRNCSPYDNSVKIDQYYQIEGQGRIVTFTDEVSIMEGGCQDLMCISKYYNYDETYFYLKDDVSYTLRVVINDEHPKSIFYDCQEINNKSFCYDQIEIAQDTIITSNFKYYAPFYGSTSCMDSIFDQFEYYLLKNPAPFTQITMTNGDFQVLEGDCDNFNCVEPYDSRISSIYKLDTSREYTIMVWGGRDYTLGVSEAFADEMLNFDCSYPAYIQCGDTIQLNNNRVFGRRQSCDNQYQVYFQNYFQANEAGVFIQLELIDEEPVSYELSSMSSCGQKEFCDGAVTDLRTTADGVNLQYFYEPTNSSGSIEVASILDRDGLDQVLFRFICDPIIPSSSCNALLIPTNGSLVTDNAFHESTIGGFMYDDNYRQSWYEVEYSDTITELWVELEDYDRGIGGRILLFKEQDESCDSLVLIEDVSIYRRVILDTSHQYYVLLNLPKEYFIDYSIHNKVPPTINTDSSSFDSITMVPLFGCDTTVFIDLVDYCNIGACDNSNEPAYCFDIIGKDRYYSISGSQGFNHELHTLLQDTVFLQKDSMYQFCLYSSKPTTFRDSVYIECFDAIVPEYFGDTLEVSCGDTLSGTTKFQIPERIPNVYNSGLFPKDFYKIYGTDSFFKLMPIDGYVFTQIRIHQEGVGLVGSYVLTSLDYGVFLKQGVTYYIEIIPLIIKGAAYTYAIYCEEIGASTSCTNYLNAYCGDTLYLNFSGAYDTTQIGAIDLEYREIHYRLDLPPSKLTIDYDLLGHSDSCTETYFNYYSYFSDLLIPHDSSFYLTFRNDEPILDTVIIGCNEIEVFESILTYQDLECNDTLSTPRSNLDIYYQFYSDYSNNVIFKRGHFFKISGQDLIASNDIIGTDDRLYMVSIEEGRLILKNAVRETHFDDFAEHFMFLEVDRYDEAYEISLTCRDIPRNTTIARAIPIECGQVVEYSFRDVFEADTPCNQYEDYQLLFYKIGGSDTYFRVNDIQRDGRYEILVMKDDDRADCLDAEFGDWYWGEMDESYIIVLFRKYDNRTSFMSIDCVEPLFRNEPSTNQDCRSEGMLCDDANPYTVNDHINESCECQGEQFQNLICANDSLYIFNIDSTYRYYHTRQTLMSNGEVLSSSHILFKSGDKVVLGAGFQVSPDGILEIDIENCPNN